MELAAVAFQISINLMIKVISAILWNTSVRCLGCLSL